VDLRQRIAGRHGGVLLFGLTPPRRTTSPEEVQRIAHVTLERLKPLDLDGLILYDIDDESDRNPEARPFPYLPTLDPADFYAKHLAEWQKPVIVYRCVGKYPEAGIESWLREQDSDRVLGVFVGASSRDKDVMTDLPRAQSLWNRTRPDLLLGGVAIPERHLERGDEHLRLTAKQANGCSFFVTQVVYDVNAAKSMVSDYYYTCIERGLAPVPMVFTLSVCGSAKTLEFLQWLGVNVPRWMQNDLRNTGDTLSESYEQCLATAQDLMTFCQRLNAPFGFNVESVSIRKAEIDASVRLAAHLRHQFTR
jgi:hypothetical protein